MMFPFESLATASRELGLIVGVLIGFGFGFVLERAGFGRANKLTAQFFLTDMTVFKVMFSAIVTAMLGLVAASSLGLADLRAISESIVSWTWIWPMLIGGFVLGIGFIISGYCPGTSLVAGASGNIDGLVTVGGVIAGTFVYSELLQIPSFARFHTSSEKGAWFLYDILPVPPWGIAIAVAVMAVGAFAGAEKVEKMVTSGSLPTHGGWLRVAMPAFASVAVVLLVGMALPSTTHAAAPAPTRTITAAELAKTIVDAPWSVRVVDVRDAAAFEKKRVPGSENFKPEEIAQLPDDGRALVVVGNAPAHNGMRQLAGGIDAWTREPLAAALSGAQVAAAPTSSAPAARAFVKPKKKSGGCSS